MSKDPGKQASGLEVAVVGMAARFPGADDVDAFWHNLCAGVESIRRFSIDELLADVPREVLADPSYVPATGYLAGVEFFDADFFGFTAREAEILDPQHRLFLETAWSALEHAGVDPERFAGPIGVYAGASTNTYVMQLSAHPCLVADLGMHALLLANEKDHLATRTSYKLNLTGPSVTVQTACSTSLVAVHLACQGLQAGESDLALAGAVTVRLLGQRGYRYVEGGIHSPDGHCRPFDAQARGTLAGDGVGVVALKRLEDAVAAGDTIHAVIRGTAINNDGRHKVGYTAPSIEGQRRVIRAALELAEVPPESITFVEAHGTGTALGDPVEVEALRQAFGPAAGPGRCALGSVKSNIGHLDTAAGIAGLIKTVLMLEHGQIPPSLHFQAPNPKIDFRRTPFVVNVRLRDWDTNGTPRRAGVSSFGIGGTNAHAVLEEAPPAVPCDPAARRWRLLLLSARDGAALEEATDRLADHLEQHPESDLADVAFTLQVGRKPCQHRRALLAGEGREAVRLLRDRDPRRLLQRCFRETDRPVAFLFPGQGSQYAGMGQDLYREEATFRHWLDRCAEILKPHLEPDLLTILFPSRGDGARPLEATAEVQPALFAFEYALARLWLSWGVRPQAMLGHSLGEYVAACLAGVFSLEDALELVALRGRLMQGLEEGAMLSVRLPAEQVRERLGASLDLAAVNGPDRCVVSGSRKAVAAWRERLEEEGLTCRLLHTSHAFHSAMMEPVSEPFAAALERVTLKPPQELVFSNLTGTLLKPEAAVEPAYWLEHLRRPVRFGDALGELWNEPSQVLLEVGPGHALTRLARRHPGYGGERVALASLPPADRNEADDAFLLTTLGRLWLAGVEIDWDGYYGEERRRRLPLPVYPFQRRRFWIDPPAGFGLISGFPEGTKTTTTAGAAERMDTPLEHGRPELETPYAAPRNPEEEILVGLWQRLMGVEPVGVYDDFFELGGDSLLATEMMAQVRRTRHVDVGLQDFFRSAHVAALAELVSEARQEGGEVAQLPAITPDPERWQESFPLTDVQQAYWIGRSEGMELGGVATHSYEEMDFRNLDLERLTSAFRKLIGHQPMLRAVIDPNGRQRILPDVPPYDVRTADLRGLGAAATEGALSEIRGQMSHQVRPCEQWPLFELRASRLAEDRCRLHFSFDLLLGDALSFLVLFRDLCRFYADPDAAVAPLELSFRDYVLAEEAMREGELYRRSRDYWLRRLDALPSAPELPLVTSLTELRRPRFVRRSGELGPDLWRSLKERCKSSGITSAGLLLAVFAQCLAQWSRQPHFVLNLTLFNRLPMHPQVNELVGDFTSTLLLEVKMGDPGTFETQARRLQSQLWGDLDHRYFSGVQVLRELAARQRRTGPVIMPVVFTSLLGIDQSTEEWGGWDGLGIERESVYSISQTPQVLLDHQVGERDDRLAFNWDAVDDAFPPGLLDQLFAGYCGWLRRLAEDPRAWNEPVPSLLPATASPQPEPAAASADQTLHGLFRAQAARRPEAVAAVAAGRHLSYGELDRCSDNLAHRLRLRGAAPNRLVAVVLEKGWRQAVAVLAVLKAGAAYLPVDPQLPEARRHHLLCHGEVGIALTEAHLASSLAWPDGVVAMPVEAPGGPAATVPDPGCPDHLAYTIFTSGSTGHPKGVMIDHRGAVNTILDLQRRFDVGPEDRILALSSLGFDLSVYDLFGLWAAGGRVIFPAEEARRDPEHWLHLLAAEGISLWNSTPSLMVMLMDSLEVRPTPLPASLRLILLSGDWIPTDLPVRLRARTEHAAVVSLGGATEASIWSVLYPIVEVDPGWASIPYGRAMTNQSLQVLDSCRRRRPVWVPGELHIGGGGLARGYWRQPAATAAAFVPHPVTGERLYRTGDWGRYLPDGEIEFLGREDFQVKIRGHRIELGEIETVLNRQPAVRAAVVTALGDPRGQRRLAAFFVPPEAPVAVLRRAVEEELPAYMVPEQWIPLAALPLTANGKVDRRSLRPPETAEKSGAAPPILSRTPLEELIAGSWAEILETDPSRFGIHDNFFELGGQSLLAARVVARLRRTLDREVSLRQLFESPTVASLARALSTQRRQEVAWPAPSSLTEPLREPLQVSFAQQRMWFLDRLDPGNPAFNLPVLVQFSGGLEPALLARAIEELCRRQEVLRAALPEVDGQPGLEIVAPWPVKLPLVDLTGLPGDVRQGETLRALAREAQHRFDIARAPLLRLVLVRLEPRHHVLLLTAHHLILDGWSLGLLGHELGAFYRALAAGASPNLPPLPVRFAEYARWQRHYLEQGPILEAQIAFWQAALGDPPTVPELPADRRRRARPSHRGGRVPVGVPKGLTTGLRKLGREQGTTLFMSLLAVLHVLLSRFAGHCEVALAAPVAGRNHVELDHLIGCFLNTLVLKVDLSGNPTGVELLARTRETVLEAWAHQDVPYERLVERLRTDRGGPPLYQALFVLQDALPPQALAEDQELRVTVPALDLAIEDLTFQFSAHEDHLEGVVLYRRELFHGATIERLAFNFLALLEELVDHPHKPIRELRLPIGSGSEPIPVFTDDLDDF
ncbi:MAG TPA: amino acid adenylation domain-containing protein [Thermoanaerobaculia bacterium]